MSDVRVHRSFGIVGLAFERTLEEQNAVRERIAVVPSALGQWSALVQAEQRAVWFDFHLVEQLRVRFVFDDDGDVAHGVAKPARNRGQGFSDELFELFAAHVPQLS